MTNHLLSGFFSVYMLITTPIPYANAKPHLGHLLEAVFNDTLARYYKQTNPNVVLSMGLDQHGLKMYEKALELGMDPAVFVKEIGKTFIDLWKEYSVHYDAFIETHDATHQRVSQIIWKRIEAAGFIYKKAYSADYCVGCEEFKTDSQLDDNHQCPLHPGKNLITLSEENYFFRLSSFSNQVRTFLETADIRPNHARTEWLNFVQEGLIDMSCSREKAKLPWGIPVPGDDEQVMYVWVEALINYLTATVMNQNISELSDDDVFEIIKQNMPVEIMYCGKDIAKFHLVVWPAMLSALNLPLPKRALVHGFINDALGRKFSKTLGNGVMPEDIFSRFGVDGTRFLLLHEVNVDGDTNFSMEAMSDAYNSHLADNLGNLVMRVSNLVEKNLDGKVSNTKRFADANFNNTHILPDQIQLLSTFDEAMKNLDVREGLDVLLKTCRYGNELLERTQPWKMVKNGQVEEVKEILEFLVYQLSIIGEKLSLFMPETGQKIVNVFSANAIAKAPVLFVKNVEVAQV